MRCTGCGTARSQRMKGTKQGQPHCQCRCLSEVLGTALAIWLAQSNIANELLAHTKGHGMGFGWLSFGPPSYRQFPKGSML